MTSNFNLSNRIWFPYQVEGLPNGNDVIFVHDVKEFIKRVKEINFNKRKHNILHSIDKLAGEKLK